MCKRNAKGQFVKGEPAMPVFWTTDKLNYLAKLAGAGTSRIEMQKLFNKKYNTSKTITAIASVMCKNGIYNKNNGRFKPGRKNGNEKPLGHEFLNVENKTGRTRVLVKTKTGYVSKSRLEYSKFFPEENIEDKCVICLDGNPLNVTKENLFAISRGEYLAIRSRLSGDKPQNKEIFMLAYTLTELNSKIQELENHTLSR